MGCGYRGCLGVCVPQGVGPASYDESLTETSEFGQCAWFQAWIEAIQSIAQHSHVSEDYEHRISGLCTTCLRYITYILLVAPFLMCLI